MLYSPAQRVIYVASRGMYGYSKSDEMSVTTAESAEEVELPRESRVKVVGGLPVPAATSRHKPSGIVPTKFKP